MNWAKKKFTLVKDITQELNLPPAGFDLACVKSVIRTRRQTEKSIHMFKFI